MRRKRSMSIEGFFRMRLKLPGSQCTLRASHASLRSCSFSFAFIALPIWYSSDSILLSSFRYHCKNTISRLFSSNLSLHCLQCFIALFTMFSACNEKAQVSIVYSQRATTPYHSIQFLPAPSRKHQLLFCEWFESGSF